VIDRHVSEAKSLAVSNENVDVDLNTPADYDAALIAFEGGDWASGVKSSSR
jgi:hypothetical protein